MGKLVAVIGNTAAGKTTLVQRLAAAAPFVTGLEQHAERPFQQPFAGELTSGAAGGYRYALANQIDYLLLRAEQERAIRAQPGIGLVDGGLDEDFFVFTRHFLARGYLTAAEFDLCERFYRFVRTVQPMPDLFVLVDAPLDVLTRRHARRARSLEIAVAADLAALQSQVDAWVACLPAERLLVMDAARDDAFAPAAIQDLLAAIHGLGNAG